jgi:hypothetical protein
MKRILRRHGSLGAAALILVALSIVVIASISSAATSSSTEPAAEPSLPPGATAAADPLANYRAPQGPVLSDAALHKVALASAARAGDTAPTSIAAVNTTLGAAISSEPHNAAVQPTPETEALNSSAVVLVIMHGHFTLNHEPIPQGAVAPTGSVLTLGVDAHTGAVELERLQDAAASGVAALGAQRSLE